MQIVFFRHGEAEEATELRDDEARSLTERGCKRTKKMTKVITKLIPSKCRIQIWSSPLIRAIQTAEIVAECIGIKIKINNAISNGDFEALRLNLAQCHKDDCIIIVGHQPFLGEWTGQLTGVRPIFRKSAAAGIHYETPADSTQEIQQELLWYVQPNFSKRC